MDFCTFFSASPRIIQANLSLLATYDSDGWQTESLLDVAITGRNTIKIEWLDLDHVSTYRRYTPGVGLEQPVMDS